MARDASQSQLTDAGLPLGLARELRRQNPWWTDDEPPAQPHFRRWPFQILLKRLTRRQQVARINVLRGPRQIGKTTLQYQLILQLLAQGVAPRRILRVQFDELKSFRALGEAEPILAILDWFADNILGQSINRSARAGEPVMIFLDEVQNIASWHVQLKAFVDRTDARLLVTGSSALRIELGRDSLAGRIQTLEIGPFRLSEIAAVRQFGNLPAFAEANGSGSWSHLAFWRELVAHGQTHAKLRDRTFAAFSERGGYPLAQNDEIEWPEVAEQLNETVIRRVIQHDLRIGERGRRRDPELLEATFRFAARYCGQAPNPSELARQARDQLSANVGVGRIRAYIKFLDSSLLIRAIEPLEMRLKKRRGAPKLCLSDHALRAAWLGEIVPLDSAGLKKHPGQSDLAGRVAESTAGYFLDSLGLSLRHLPTHGKSPGLDYILTAGDHRIPVEIKYQNSIDPIRDTRALVDFVGNPVNQAPIGIVVTKDECNLKLPERLVAVPLKTLLLAH